MKKVLTLFSGLLIFAGLKAQTAPPAVKKETVKPGTVQPVANNTDSVFKNAALKQVNSKAIKYDHIKKAPVVQMKDVPVQMKEAPAVTKPHKG